MRQQSIRKADIIHPYFTEETAKESVEKKKKFRPWQKEVRWISSIPLYIPFWLVDVEMELKDPRGRKQRLTSQVCKIYTILVNGLTNRGLTVRGDLITQRGEAQGIYLDDVVEKKDVRETARLEALAGSKRMINPPPHRVLEGMRLVYYPLALVKLSVGGKEEIQVFDYYRGGIDKYMMRYLRLKEKMEQKEKPA